MQHIEEALLHEYLDRRGESDPALARIDEHLAGCAECRARLQAADALRDSTDAILSAASPSRMKAPSFESVVAAANARAASADVVAPAAVIVPRRSSWHDTRRMAWAATIVLALGAGWIGNTLYRDVRRGEERAPTVADAPSNKVPAGPGYVAPAVDVTASADAAAPVASAPSAGPATGAASTRAREPRSLAQAEAGAQSAADARSRVDLPPPAVDPRGEKTVVAQTPPSVLERPTNALAQVDVTTGGIAASQAAAAAAAANRVRPDSTRAVELDALTIRGSRNPLVPRDQVSSRSRIDDEGMVRPGSWTAMSGDEALLKAGGEIVRIAGLKIIDYATATDQYDTRIRVRQITARGDTITVVQTPVAVLGKMAAASPESANGRAFAAAPAPVAAAFSKESSGYIFGDAYQVGRINGSRRIAIIARDASLLENVKPEIARTR